MSENAFKCSRLVVAAIDFGTTFSGYAYATHHDLANKPPKIHTPNWYGGSHISNKNATILLLNSKQEFVSFGYEAEDAYIEFAAEGKHKDYYFFRRFKMNLYESENLKRDTMIKDEQGKMMNAIKVFSLCIKYLKDHLMKNLYTKVSDIKDSDVAWVLTVPAIWNDSSKQFMREAALQAGIQNDSLSIALEPEAASLFCMHVPVEKEAKFTPFAVGQKYMVVDIGGGTVDITVHEVVSKGLRELFSASGGAWGGTRVDAAFDDFLSTVFGKDVFEEFKKNCVEDLVEIRRQFETKKRNIDPEKAGKDTITLPAALMEIYKSKKKIDLETGIQKGPLGNKLSITTNKLRVERSLMRGWFKESCEKTVDHVKELLKKDSCKGTSTILLVGGFSESAILQKAFRDAFPDKRLVIPEEAGLAVLKGAVLYGNNPITIVSRVAKYSYGIRVFRDFVEGVHPKEKKEMYGSRIKCKDVFAKHVTKGQDLVVGEAQSSQKYNKVEAEQLSFIFDIFTSPEEDPKFVTDKGCSHIGQLEVDAPKDGKGGGVSVKMIFGGTELIVHATEEGTGKEKKATFNFLQ
ncbi:heat shock 70 kDa protein 12A-like [Dreissena polymorpha]|uniref:Heat shock 70 kDa protein n=1 Tax=Dreissena polymorpha TaxID=45954 RepID=A0A9D4K5N7_DREPO|nr:heat shock 70 kDa protein 12A-like [Dreissena polymorpha]XP_052282393.1 heat shock 70 kDa protein 12A-like [Dreissena polymorpha]XP_052282394.1 heat shock 70 kDa protein 12A-like [Dreissena polymorpha]KAH3833374.1 hypothetical protein DPMN_106681 [Dreissena polymorpha]